MKEPYKIPYNINSINDYKAKGIVNTKCVIVKKINPLLNREEDIIMREIKTHEAEVSPT